jgi:NAD(P)-dependent dehydrogenase (short-subunit alcohol dehydrogenase family)
VVCQQLFYRLVAIHDQRKENNTMSNWTEADIPDQSGRTVLVTGANSGLGLRSATVLAARGARVLLACRSPERGERALRTIRDAGGNAELVALDLADLASVRAAAEQVGTLCPDGLDVLMNNAGMTALQKQLTKDGFELQFGTNHLGPAALTWLLLPLLNKRPGARVVTLVSITARAGVVDTDDPNFERRRYRTMTSYNQAKLASLVFMLELARRLQAAGRDVLSVAAHPGYTATGVFAHSAARSVRPPLATMIKIATGLMDRVFGQDVAIGVLPQLYAATAAEVRGGEYYGPAGFWGLRGYPKRIAVPNSALRPGVPERLWELTARLTGITPDPNSTQSPTNSTTVHIRHSAG